MTTICCLLLLVATRLNLPQSSEPITKAASILKWLEGSDASSTTQRVNGEENSWWMTLN